MKSEVDQRKKVQVRMGAVTLESYIFFPRELGDLLLEPGDEVILVARQGEGNRRFRDAKKDSIFEKVRGTIASKLVLDRMKGRGENDYHDILNQVKEAIREFEERRK